MEKAPKDVDVRAIYADIVAIKSVREVHDFHVWSLSINKVALTAHVRSDNPLRTLKSITNLLRNKYKIYHNTV